MHVLQVAILEVKGVLLIYSIALCRTEVIAWSTFKLSSRSSRCSDLTLGLGARGKGSHSVLSTLELCTSRPPSVYHLTRFSDELCFVELVFRRQW
ncbi:unnamed protein product [Arabidopsis lyrata]|nr:unnamed protein product [Arabidopsis lyrata]